MTRLRDWREKRRTLRVEHKRLHSLDCPEGWLHAWDWDWAADALWDMQGKFRGPDGQWYGIHPPYVGPFGDYQKCDRCGDKRLINEPSR